MKTEKQMAMAAAGFAKRWKGRGYERGESQPFWIDLLSNVFVTCGSRPPVRRCLTCGSRR